MTTIHGPAGWDRRDGCPKWTAVYSHAKTRVITCELRQAAMALPTITRHLLRDKQNCLARLSNSPGCCTAAVQKLSCQLIASLQWSCNDRDDQSKTFRAQWKNVQA